MFLEHFIYVQRKAFSRVVVKTWNEIPNNLRRLSKNVGLHKKKLKIVLFDMLKAKDSYVEFDDITRDWQNLFAIARFRCIEVLFQVCFTVTGVKKIISLYRGSIVLCFRRSCCRCCCTSWYSR